MLIAIKPRSQKSLNIVKRLINVFAFWLNRQEAHKRLITINHPDRGGSPYIATKINEAKDYLENTSKGTGLRQ